jgi:hypothetical protein
MRKCANIYEEAIRHLRVLLCISLYMKKFSFLFYQCGELLRGHRGQRLLLFIMIFQNTCLLPVEDEERQRDSRDDAPGQQAVELALHSLTSTTYNNKLRQM